MSVTINFSKNTSAPWQSNANMLKSTREKIQRQEERDGKIAFFETQKQNLKNQKADTIEEIAKKLEKFHTYEDEIAAAKQEYNSSQMFYAMDEARERGEKLAEAAKKNKPKTEEERKKEALKEAEGDESGDGMLSEIMDTLDEIEEKQLEAAESTAGQTEEALLQDSMKDDTLVNDVAGSAENVTSASYAEQGKTAETAAENGNVVPDKYSHKNYVPFDVRI